MAARPDDLHHGAHDRPADTSGGRSGDRDLVVTLMPMRRRHLRAVLRIEGQAEHRGWSLGLFMGELGNERGRRYLVAKVGGSVVGFAGMLFLGSDGHVTTISVDQAWRGRGIGTRLMLALCREAIERDVTALTLEVRAGNEPAQAMYRSFGFAPAGIRRNYYQETNEDALVMWVHDADGPEYAARLDALDAALPGRTILEALAGPGSGERA
jgi:[ribosomal protein S18]-alanine N-acetyltransferase